MPRRSANPCQFGAHHEPPQGFLLVLVTTHRVGVHREHDLRVRPAAPRRALSSGPSWAHLPLAPGAARCCLLLGAMANISFEPIGAGRRLAAPAADDPNDLAYPSARARLHRGASSDDRLFGPCAAAVAHGLGDGRHRCTSEWECVRRSSATLRLSLATTQSRPRDSRVCANAHRTPLRPGRQADEPGDRPRLDPVPASTLDS